MAANHGIHAWENYEVERQYNRRRGLPAPELPTDSNGVRIPKPQQDAALKAVGLSMRAADTVHRHHTLERPEPGDMFRPYHVPEGDESNYYTHKDVNTAMYGAALHSGPPALGRVANHPKRFHNREMGPTHPTHPRQRPVPGLGQPDPLNPASEYPLYYNQAPFVDSEMPPARVIFTADPNTNTRRFEGVVSHNPDIDHGPFYNSHLPAQRIKRPSPPFPETEEYDAYDNQNGPWPR